MGYITTLCVCLFADVRGVFWTVFSSEFSTFIIANGKLNNS